MTDDTREPADDDSTEARKTIAEEDLEAVTGGGPFHFSPQMGEAG